MEWKHWQKLSMEHEEKEKQKMQKRKNYMLVLFILLGLTIFLSLLYGAVKVPIKDIVKILSNKLFFTEFIISKKSFIPIVFYVRFPRVMTAVIVGGGLALCGCTRSEEHTSELQSRQYLVCRLLLEK